MGMKQSHEFVNNIQPFQLEREPNWRYNTHELHSTLVKEWTYSLQHLGMSMIKYDYT